MFRRGSGHAWTPLYEKGQMKTIVSIDAAMRERISWLFYCKIPLLRGKEVYFRFFAARDFNMASRF